MSDTLVISQTGAHMSTKKPILGNSLMEKLTVLPYLSGLAVILGFFFWPLVEVFLRSFSLEGNVTLSGPDFTLSHYAQVATLPYMRSLILQTAVVSLLAAVVTLGFAFPVAYLMSRVRPEVAAVIVGFIMLEFFSSIVVRLFGVSVMLGSSGPLNWALRLIGIGEQQLLYNTFATTVGMAHYLIPIAVLVLYSAMLNIDQNLMLAAKTLGASARHTFWKIYFPQIRSSVVAAASLCFILAAGFFLTPSILGGNSDITIPLYIVQQVSLYEWGRASALGVLLLIVTVIGYYISVRLGRGSLFAFASEGVGKGTASDDPLRLTTMTVVLWVITGFVVLALLSPLVVVIASSFNGSPFLNFPPSELTFSWYKQAFGDPLWTSSIWKSVRVSLAVGVLGCALGLLLARLKSQVTNRHIADWIGVLALLPLIVPTILTAIGVFGMEARLKLLGTDIGLILPLAVMTMPYAFVIIDGAMSRGTKDIETAAWTLGASRVQAFWMVVVPRILSALVASTALCAVIAWDEITIALFQTGFEKTLPVLIYSTVYSGPTPEVSAVASVAMLAVLLALTAFMLFRRRVRMSPRRVLQTNEEL